MSDLYEDNGDCEPMPIADHNQFFNVMMLGTANAFGWEPPFDAMPPDFSLDDPGIDIKAVITALERARSVLLASPDQRPYFLAAGLDVRCPQYDDYIEQRECFIGLISDYFGSTAIEWLETCVAFARDKCHATRH